MKTVRALIYRDVVWSVAFVTLAFLSLFFFIDFLEELQDVGRGGVTVWTAALWALFALPWRMYELLPIAVLIGTIYAMARLAQSSEYTILRTGGLGPVRALRLLLAFGVWMAAATFLVGEFIAPFSERQSDALTASLRGGANLGQAGAWIKEHRPAVDGTALSVSVNVQQTAPDGLMRGIRIFEHDATGRLVRQIEAGSGRLEAEKSGSVWHLQQARQALWPPSGDDAAPLRTQVFDSLDWRTSLDERLVNAALSPMESMTIFELWRYSQHLDQQEQSAQRYELQFWKRAFYPWACVVMIALSLPFAYLHARSGGVSLKVFGGIMLGISFILLNNMFGHLGLLHDWTPWLTSAVPSFIYIAFSLAAFTWLVRYR